MDANDDALLFEIMSAMQRNAVNVVRHELDHRRDLLTCHMVNGATIVHHACCLGKMDIVILLFGYFKADLEMVDQNGYTPLSLAVYLNNLEVAVYLLRLGAQVNCICNRGFWPLYVATDEKNIGMIWVLIKAGANVHLLHQTDGCAECWTLLVDTLFGMLQSFLSSQEQIMRILALQVLYRQL